MIEMHGKKILVTGAARGIGFGIADLELAGYLQRARHPFNVSRLAEVAALAMRLPLRNCDGSTLRFGSGGCSPPSSFPPISTPA